MDETWGSNAFWILSCPMHAEYNLTMQEFAGVNEQHKYCNLACQKRDIAITWQLITAWSVSSIFTPSRKLLIIDLVCVCVDDDVYADSVQNSTKKLSVLLPWYSNHKHKIEELF